MGGHLPSIFSPSQQSAQPLRRRYELDSDTEGDRQQFPPHIHSDDDTYSSSISSPAPDIEAQHPSPEMAETRRSRFVLPRWSRPTIRSFLSIGGRTERTDDARPRPRPSSSHYSGDPDEEPKTPVLPTLGIPDMPSTRLHLPTLQRTWTRGSNGPPTRPVTAAREEASFAGHAQGMREPPAVVPAVHGGMTRGQDRRRARGSDGSDTGRRRRRHRRHRSDRYRTPLDEEEGGRRQDGQEETEVVRQHRRHRSDCRRRCGKPHPKRFLFCFPWVKSKRARTHILRCFVSGLFLTLLLSVYLALSVTRNINSNEFSVLLILIILFVTIFFCHALIRLCMLMVKAGKNPHETEEDERVRRLAFSQMTGPAGYAIPRQPIRVVLARDEEAAGLESETAKTSPPAYGLWRESVRVDPNRIYWARNETAPAPPSLESVPHERGPRSLRDDSSNATSEGQGPSIRRPPSYASDDGVSYVVEAQPRSTAPTTDVPIAQHPPELDRPLRTARWC